MTKQSTLFVIIALMLMCFFLSGCSQHVLNNNLNISSGTDYTVSIDSFTVDGVSSVYFGNGSADMAVIYNDASDLSEMAQTIVIGEVIDIHYNDENARPSTIFDFQLSKVLRGSLEENDTISVEEFGGYIRKDVFTNVYGTKDFEMISDYTFIEVAPLGDAPSPKLGDQYILFLTESDIIDGAYCTLGTYMGKYVIGSNNMVSRHDPDAELKASKKLSTTYITTEQLTVNDIIHAVETTPFDAQLFNERFGTSTH